MRHIALAVHLFFNSALWHFETPEIDAHEWRLSVEGEVHRPGQLDFTSLRNLPARSVTATLECAGNSRMLLAEKVKGVQWEPDAVGTAEWTGAPRPDSKEATAAASISKPKTDAEIPFAPSQPLVKAPEVRVAWAMNGEPLSARHGFLIRAIVPAWYGMASVKWLRRIVVTACPFQGYFQTFEYSHWDNLNGLPSLAPCGRAQSKPGSLFPRRAKRSRETAAIGSTAQPGQANR